jgi:hypothetical protein
LGGDTRRIFEFKANLDYIARPCLKAMTTTTKKNGCMELKEIQSETRDTLYLYFYYYYYTLLFIGRS